MAEPTTVDLSNCEREPIHRLGRIQAVGAVLVVSADWMIAGFSENFTRITGVVCDGLLAEPVSNLFDDAFLSRLKQALLKIDHRDQVVRLLNINIRSDSAFDVCAHFSGDAIIIEFEPAEAIAADELLTRLQRYLNFKHPVSLDDLLRQGVRNIAELTGFDRVMLYRFHPDLSGEVAAEQCKPGVDSFLGLRYPASDIPSQARALYLRNLTRQIHDVDNEGVALLPPMLDLDLSMCNLRAVSSIHLEYLRNMGVKASFSVSIIVNGELWGLFACHHYSIRALSRSNRVIAEMIGERFAQEVGARLLQSGEIDLSSTRQIHLNMMATLDNNKSLFANLSLHADRLAQLIPCDSFVMCVGGEYLQRGKPISTEDIRLLERAINRQANAQILSVDCLRDWLSTELTLSERFSGFLAIPVSRQPRDLLIYLRQEEPQTVYWAGNPEKPVELGPNGSRLTPRKSFEAWRQIRHDSCAPWTEQQLALAQQIRHNLLEVIVRSLDSQAVIVRKANEQQDLLIHELNHRTRNMLSLISSFVNQTSSVDISVDEFKHILGSRIQALAVAQKQLTECQWNFAPLQLIVDAEIRALVSDPCRVRIDGPEVMLSPKAFTAMTLVLHELLTNAIKHGALSVAGGLIEFHWQVSQSGELEISWQESGITIDQEYSERHGFGMLIIERSIPHDLNGRAIRKLERNGLECEFVIPALHVRRSDRSQPSPSSPVSGASEPFSSAGTAPRALVVEDNMLIAVDNMNMLKQCGFAKVDIASNVPEALQYLNSGHYDACLLDINLVKETCEAVADQCLKQGVAFIFASGYSVLSSRMQEAYPGATVLEKPFSANELKAALTLSTTNG